MTIRVRLFAHLRERFGVDETTVEAGPRGTHVRDVWRKVTGEDELPRHVLVAVNLEYADTDAPVRDGDEVAFFPPVTGG